MKYRFLGDTASVYHAGGVIELHSFGQQVELADEPAAHLVSRGVVLPEDEFAQIGFTEQHLKEYPTAISHNAAPDDFKRRKLDALKRAQELRNRANDAANTSGRAAKEIQPLISPVPDSTEEAV